VYVFDSFVAYLRKRAGSNTGRCCWLRSLCVSCCVDMCTRLALMHRTAPRLAGPQQTANLYRGSPDPTSHAPLSIDTTCAFIEPYTRTDAILTHMHTCIQILMRADTFTSIPRLCFPPPTLRPKPSRNLPEARPTDPAALDPAERHATAAHSGQHLSGLFDLAAAALSHAVGGALRRGNSRA
jgi:hypothetical protein